VVVVLRGWRRATGLASLPGRRRLDGKAMFGIALLCGIGFTMSLFIASLAFEAGGASFQGLERLGILAGSLVSGVAGYFVLRAATRSA
jgi:NhaA family Na+:H+ antiporter